MIFNLITSFLLLFLIYKTGKFLLRQFSILVLIMEMFWLIALLGLWFWHTVLEIEQSEYAVAVFGLALGFIVYLIVNSKFHYMEVTITSLVRTVAISNSRRNS